MHCCHVTSLLSSSCLTWDGGQTCWLLFLACNCNSIPKYRARESNAMTTTNNNNNCGKQPCNWGVSRAGHPCADALWAQHVCNNWLCPCLHLPYLLGSLARGPGCLLLFILFSSWPHSHSFIPFSDTGWLFLWAVDCWLLRWRRLQWPAVAVVAFWWVRILVSVHRWRLIVFIYLFCYLLLLFGFSFLVPENDVKLILANVAVSSWLLVSPTSCSAGGCSSHVPVMFQ